MREDYNYGSTYFPPTNARFMCVRTMVCSLKYNNGYSPYITIQNDIKVTRTVQILSRNLRRPLSWTGQSLDSYEQPLRGPTCRPWPPVLTHPFASHRSCCLVRRAAQTVWTVSLRVSIIPISLLLTHSIMILWFAI